MPIFVTIFYQSNFQYDKMQNYEQDETLNDLLLRYLPANFEYHSIALVISYQKLESLGLQPIIQTVSQIIKLLLCNIFGN